MVEGFALRSLVSVFRIGNKKSQLLSQVDAIRKLLDGGAEIEQLTQKYLRPDERKTVRRLFYEAMGCSPERYGQGPINTLRAPSFDTIDTMP